MSDVFARNPFRRDRPAVPGPPGWDPGASPALSFHRSLSGYAPTPVRRLPRLARELGLGEILVKDESSRLGLPAFKVLGASWAAARLIERVWLERIGGETPDPFRNPAALRRLGRLTLATASDGNHGRAVAWAARRLGLDAVVYMPRGTAPARVAAIEGEGARVEVRDGTYDDCVRWIEDDARRHGWLVLADTAYPGYSDVPRWILEGYVTMFAELEDGPFSHALRPAVDAVLLQAGVGGFAAAGAAYLARRYGPRRPRLVVVEPTAAACFLASFAAGDGRPRRAAGALDSIMAGLDCGVPSEIAWPILREAADLAVAIEDRWALEAMRLAAREDLIAGESGAAGLAALLALCRSPDLAAAREELGLGPRSRVLVVNTEGATDPEGYRRVVGGG